MKKLGSLILMVFFLFGLMMLAPGCKKSNISGSDEIPFGVTWLTQSINYAAGTVRVMVRTHTITFNENGVMALTIDCNSCAGNYKISEGNLIEMAVHACTEVHCGDNENTVHFQAAIQNIYRYTVMGDELRLYFSTMAGEAFLILNKI
jgi:heat shock protein HslJ